MALSQFTLTAGPLFAGYPCVVVSANPKSSIHNSVPVIYSDAAGAHQMSYRNLLNASGSVSGYVASGVNVGLMVSANGK